ncbi:MAG: alpha-galactosidase [Lachnospiraceae bacterium]|nr:alpha-galactosidase [Lachnospiraceae bacterium]
MIAYDESNRLFFLETPHTSYILGIVDEEGFPGQVYYGARIPREDVSYLMRTKEPPFVPSENARERGSFLDRFPSEYPGNALGDYREGAAEVLDGDGHRAVQFLYKEHRIYDGKPGLEGLPATFAKENEAQTLELVLEDPVLRLRAVLLYTVFADTDAIARSVRLVNDSDRPVRIEKVMSLALDLEPEESLGPWQVLTLHGSWARERQMDFRPLGYGKTSVGSTKGESSHQEHPFLGLASAGITQESGIIYGFHFLYSGNFLAQAEKTQFDSVRILLGIHPANFEWTLAPGEHFQAPEAVCVCSLQGLGGMSRSLHDLYRGHLIRSPYLHRERPILINNWEATYFDFNTEKLLSIAREAKKSGIEMLVMDDGWFGKRDDDNSGLGDWTVNEKKLPGGLKYLVEEVNRIGLKFGIWMEPEMISPDSDLYRAHPDWAIAIPGRVPCRSRNQFVLDLSNPQVEEYVWSCIESVLGSANIAYLKWDMNRQLTDLGSAYLPADRTGELCHRYMLAVYRLQERLITRFPNLLLENCSGGGARFDPGMLYYSPQIWCSDDTDAAERLGIQEGTALLYPLSTMGAHVSDCPNHTVGRVTPFRTRGHVALSGTFGYELDITRIPEEDRAQIPAQVATYHRLHELVREGDYYRIASFRENGFYDCWMSVRKDRSEALLTFVQVRNRPNAVSRRIRIPGLDPAKIYRIEGEIPGEPAPEVLCHGQALSGAVLANAGILLKNPWGDFGSILLHLREWA